MWAGSVALSRWRWPITGQAPAASGGSLVFRLRLPTRPLISECLEFGIARECFTTNDRIFASRPKLVAGKLLGYDHAMLGTSPYGPYWRHVRKIATLQLLTNHRLHQLQHIQILEVRDSINKLHELCVNDKKDSRRVLVEMNAWFRDLTLNTIFKMVIGKRFSTAFEGSGGAQYREAVRSLIELFGVFVPSDSFPFLRWLDLGGYEKAMKKAGKVLDEVFDKWIEEHRKKKNSGEMEMKEQDFMDVMLSTVEDDGQLFGYDVETVTKATCLTMILGGADTTTITMTWALSLLLNNQEALRKVQRELDEHVGRQRRVKESDVKNLIYLQAVVKETLRLYPAVPLLVPHESMEDCTVAGYHIPAGTRLLVNLRKLQKDPLVWEDPCEFRPERFLTNQKDVDVRGQNLQLIPFGSGRRVCAGISFALQVMHLTLANLLHEFEISLGMISLFEIKLFGNCAELIKYTN
ncbi:cytochrome P450 CYP82D47-like [Momordica charantia]|uniref:Cytochrome P450 CYP82D47-like n=1 Tax=Momordica charantia TaxID=3673 RepID=A0A6J1C633_MOMCH|nr:cytochrome P450 CYP82D47-like [Momordica charantia]